MKKIYILSICFWVCFFINGTTHNFTYRQSESLVKEGKAKKLSVDLPQKNRNLNPHVRQIRNSETSLHGLFTESPSLSNPFVKQGISPHQLDGNIYGYLFYSDDYNFYPGLYKLNQQGYDLQWPDPLFEDRTIYAYNGWYTDGKVKGIFPDVSYGYIYGYYGYAIDFETGELLEFKDYGLDKEVIFYLSSLNKENGKIYGYAYDITDEGNMYWSVADSSSPENAEALLYSTDNYCYSLCYNSKDGYIYGVNINQEFVRIEEDGSQIVLAVVPDAYKCGIYTTGMVWNPIDESFYWNCNYNENYGYASLLYKISENGSFELERNFMNGEEFSYLITPDEKINPNRPQRPFIDEVTFIDGSLSGVMTVTLPKYFEDGKELPETIDYTALLDEEYYFSSTSAPGSQIKVDYQVPDNGYHIFSIFVSLNGVSSSSVFIRKYVGNDTPSVPENVILTMSEVTWDAVTTGIHNGYVDNSDMMYKVFLNGNFLGETSETLFPVNIPEDEPLNGYVAEVIAVCNNLESEPGLSNKVLSGKALVPPIFLIPTEDEFDLMTVVNLNPLAAYGWKWGTLNGMQFAESGYTDYADQPMDAYLFLPPFKVENKDTYYTFTMETGIKRSWYPDEYIEVVYSSSPSPEGVLGTLVETFKPTAIAGDGNWQNIESLVKLPSEGEYYIGIRCLSAGDQMGVLARNFSIVKSDVTNISPAEPTYTSIIPSPQGELSATVNFTFPTLYMNGKEIDRESLLTAKAIVEGLDEEFVTNGYPGKEGNMKVNTVQGMNTVILNISLDGMEGPNMYLTVYTGVGIPAAPEIVRVTTSESMLTANISWTPVTKAETSGEYVDPENITYNLYLYYDMGSYGAWGIIEGGLRDTSYEYVLDYGSPQQDYIFGVKSVNEAGWSEGTTYDFAILGTPYELPMVDNFDNGEVVTSTEKWYIYSGIDGEAYNGSWFFSDVRDVYTGYQGESHSAMIGHSPNGRPCKGALGVPRFSTAFESDVKIFLDIVDVDYAAPFSLWAQVYDNDNLIEIGSFEVGLSQIPEIKKVSFVLPSGLNGYGWVQVYILTDYPTGDEVFGLCGIGIEGADANVNYMPSDFSIRAVKSGIEFSGFNGKAITISSIDGKVIFNGICRSDRMIYEVNKGIYLVRTETTNTKVIVN